MNTGIIRGQIGVFYQRQNIAIVPTLRTLIKIGVTWQRENIKIMDK